MSLAELNLTEYSKQLASSAPTPGGGAATAQIAAQGANLLAMVCNLTVGKEKYAQHEVLVAETLDKAEEISQKALRLMDEDAVAFGEVAKLYKLPNKTAEEKEIRQKSMEIALQGCTKPPLELMKLCLEGLHLTKSVLGKSNQSAVSDLGVAALFFGSALEGAWLNVSINLAYMKSETFLTETKREGEAVLAEGKTLSQGLYQEVLAEFTKEKR